MSETFTYLVHQVAEELAAQERVQRRAGADPMRMTHGGTVTSSGFRRVIPAGGYGYPAGGAAGATPEQPTILIDGPVPVNPQTGRNWGALRICAIPATPLTYVSPTRALTTPELTLQTSGNNAVGAYGALLRITGGTSFQGGRATREFVVGGAQEGAFEIGEMENVKLELIYSSADTVVQWQWFDDATGIVAQTPLYSRQFQYTFVGAFPAVNGNIQAAPDGAKRMFTDSDVLVAWWNTAFGTAAGAGVFTGFNTAKGVGGLQAVATSTGIELLTPYFNLLPAAGSPFLSTNLIFELAQL